MRFSAPFLLFLLLLIPLAAWVGWPARGVARRREWTSLILRITLLLCIVFSLAGLEIVRTGNELAVVFLMDVSYSMPQQALDAEAAYVREAIESMGPDDQSAIILFGADALVDRSGQIELVEAHGRQAAGAGAGRRRPNRRAAMIPSS